ncbi:hypothetical protein GIB67_001657 [Kingdonia uniflora]|uniref:Uncharacterized protein n=1 Tax=Kingdonia uniflora TaxID=39325 RepID=A0A7J7L0Z2_9MAGN|nr:hypothetical protein GIB67_001657 [Kingdonia uniflora]
MGVVGLESLSSLRVLLVESDDSTRMIISALLRKCGFRVVSIADGFKAWEILKGRPYDIDLVLTELDLPSISGFTLLNNIMEHSICKNIPTIIMSSYDSMNAVLKCTSRGAADFLVKPLRKNELKNLWQHVWRKKSLKDLTDKRKLEAVNEDNFSFKHSSDCVEYINENKECSEKGSDAQSSCTKPDIEIESICIQDLQELSHPKFRSASLINGVNALKYGGCEIKLDEKLLMDRYDDQGMITMNPREDVASKPCSEDTEIYNENKQGYKEHSQPLREAVDFIGAFDNHLNAYNTYYQQLLIDGANVYSHSNDAATRFSSTPLLELSLNGSRPNDHKIYQNDDRRKVNHSSVSAFSRYNNKTVQPHFGALASHCNEVIKECASRSSKMISPWNDVKLDHYLDNMISPVDEQPKAFSVCVPFKSGQVDGSWANNDATLPSMYCAQSDPPPLWSSNSSNHKQSAQDLEYLNDLRNVSPVAGQSANSSLCNSVISQRNSSGSESNCNGNGENVSPVSVNDGSLFVSDESRVVDIYYSTHREAALAKFRLKRKDRCFDKKVRYQSRKRLAETRPRVKGQFVRQIPS